MQLPQVFHVQTVTKVGVVYIQSFACGFIPLLLKTFSYSLILFVYHLCLVAYILVA